MKLGGAVAITDEGSNPPPRPVATFRSNAVQVTPGEQTLRPSLTVSYELAP